MAILIGLGANNSEAFARAPKSANEHNLLYWRYLCENQPQKESPAVHHDSTIELECPVQGWKVIAKGDQVEEVVEHAR